MPTQKEIRFFTTLKCKNSYAHPNLQNVGGFMGRFGSSIGQSLNSFAAEPWVSSSIANLEFSRQANVKF